MNTDERHMKSALRLAKRAEGRTSPNPMVGAVVVKSCKVAGRGYHEKAGLPHAEINALKEAGRRAKGATLYVTLEPCDHFGRTPPCTETIIKSGIKRVVAAMTDPNPLNNGKGIRKLRGSGIKVRVGILEDEAKALNEPYIKFIKKKMPYVTIKSAQTLDGKIATRTGKSRWITGPDSRRYAHRLRSMADAVMVGAKTVLKDDPLLMSRIPGSRQPVRVIVQGRSMIPLNASVFSDMERSPVIIATSKNSPRIAAYKKRGAQVLAAGSKDGKVNLRSLLRMLAGNGIVNVLVEGGGELNECLIREGLADRILFFIAPKIIGGKDAKTPVEGLGVDSIGRAFGVKNLKVRRFKEDILLEGKMN